MLEAVTPATARERVVVIDAGHPLTGILTEAATEKGAPPPAVIILNAGIVHRIGPNRMFVKLGRRLAARGWDVLRFDHSGIGDTPARADTLAHQQSAPLEAREAMNWLARERGVTRFVLLGLCSGAVTAFRVGAEDPRVAGVALLNGRGFDGSEAWNAHVLNKGWARWYLRGAIFSADSWKRVLTGRIRYGRLAAVLWRQVKGKFKPPEQVGEVAGRLAGQMQTIVDRGARALLVFSENDHAIDYFAAMLGGRAAAMRKSGALTERTVAGADHTFTLLAHQEQMMREVEAWLDTLAAESVEPSPATEPARATA
jgi:pimeloyl-ACP methyl ester carboxylesterase